MEVLIIRHAESQFNKAVVEALEHANVGSQNKSLVLYVKALKRPELIDAGITELGRKQCAESAAENAERLKKVKLVLVSPMNRALETADLIFNKHLHDKNGGQRPEFVVVPDMHEVLESCCDIPMGAQEKATKYPDWDFSAMLEIEKRLGFIWFSETMFNQHTRRLIREEVAKSAEEGDLQKAYRVVDVLRDHLPAYLEGGPDLFFRSQRFASWLWGFLKDKGLKAEEVALVGHQAYFETLSATEFDAQNNPKNGRMLANCEVAQLTIRQPLI